MEIYEYIIYPFLNFKKFFIFHQKIYFCYKEEIIIKEKKLEIDNIYLFFYIFL
jgi:hypothetical protein